MNDLVKQEGAEFKIGQSAVDAKESILSMSGVIGAVRNEAEQKHAVEIQMAAAKLLKAAESTRKDVLKPYNEVTDAVNRTFREFVKDLVEEKDRLGMLIGNYAAAEDAKAMAAQAAVMKELSEMEKAREEEVAKATNVEDIDAIRERYARQAAALSSKVPNRAEGQRVISDWVIKVENLHLLYSVAPQCVELKPKLATIKEMLDVGIQLKGIKAERKVTSTVRVKKETAVEV